MAEPQAPEMDEIRRRLSIFFNQNQAMVERYISLHGNQIVMRLIQDVRDEMANIPQGSTPEEVKATKDSGDSPVFSIELECPCCKQKAVLHRELRASAMSIKNDPFLVPVYFPIGKFQKLNYLTVNVAVCPRCLFASPYKKDFVQFNRTTRQTIPSQISMGILAEIQDSLAERQEIAESVAGPVDFTQCPRPFPVAILSYRLAEQRARMEAESKQPFAVFKRANYWTRISLLQRQSGIEDTPSLEKALSLFKDAFFKTDFPNANMEFQSCFIIFSIYLRFGQIKEAREYVGVMEQSKKQVEERKDPAALQALNTWLGMAKARWEDKDSPTLWDIPS
jgi:uncharacterized protein (DUF2225 family)